MFFGHNKRKFYHKIFYIRKDQIEITREYRLISLGLISTHMTTLNHQVNGKVLQL